MHLLLGLVDTFFGYNFPKPEPVWMKFVIYGVRGHGAHSGPENSPKYGTLRWGVCDRAVAQTVQLRAMGIISGASRHHKDACLLYVSFGWERTVWAL